MFIFLKSFIIIFLFIWINPFCYDEDVLNDHQNYLFLYFFFLYINLLANYDKKTKLDLDIVFKYLILIFKTPNFFFNYILNILKKIYVYLVHFKYKFFFSSINIFLKKYLLGTFLWWRPLFKKTSYFGYYRSNRSKWIK